MEQKKERKAETAVWEKKKKQILMAVILGVLLIAGAIGGILYKVYAGQGTVGGLLQIYYETMYSSNGKSFDDLCDCLSPDIRDEYYMVVTNGGINFTQLNNWRTEAMLEVGENVKTKVEVLQVTQSTTGGLGAIRETNPSAEELVGVDFRVTLTGDQGYLKMEGYAACVRVGEDWYIATQTVDLGVVERSGEE